MLVLQTNEVVSQLADVEHVRERISLSDRPRHQRRPLPGGRWSCIGFGHIDDPGDLIHEQPKCFFPALQQENLTTPETERIDIPTPQPFELPAPEPKEVPAPAEPVPVAG